MSDALRDAHGAISEAICEKVERSKSARGGNITVPPPPSIVDVRLSIPTPARVTPKRTV